MKNRYTGPMYHYKCQNGHSTHHVFQIITPIPCLHTDKDGNWCSKILHYIDLVPEDKKEKDGQPEKD